MNLTDDEIAALYEALDDEYKAHTTYSQVIEDFGEVRPFINIRDAEKRHIDALLVLFEKYNVSIPENSWHGAVPTYQTLKHACEAGVQAEIENGEMYDRLLLKTQRSDILNVLKNLQAASQERHLPAFQRCVERNFDSGPERRGGIQKRVRRRGGAG